MGVVRRVKSALGEPEAEEAEDFESSVLSYPNADVNGDSNVPTKKRKVEDATKASKKLRVPIVADVVEEEDEEPPNDPGVKDSQNLEGFIRKTTVSVILKGHLFHLRTYYHIQKDILMRVPLANETPDLFEGGCTPGF
ncbi:hypothetical protein LIER_25788 [Lithospermum erythrorhizon]|uniref:Uncharacterized protein n=1 Tax=Lithospermum erythrorhizon TaxID=34254 RepID=A0AAV3R7L1_LITER